ncbi:type III pantothenate kinase [Aneurinibacillus sp. Ricciae_BoGa-3]|uniref:type III pantothenate kinase n=1 Tax=Aneurinibacillus sp. Ricciae_BoGa-3 TaxID=3022697 RepID=UPI00233FFE29|nr:type III pantothenate kinase [Aneurinibacillus sp. Ricciae_BoGa-3]WCK54644.1 type III pantothenate kinase [Aneurinibacillus sp. Ricciae_BoGa-3]
MLFVIDVGNTNVVLGVFEGNELTQHWRIGTDRTKTDDEFGMLVKNLFTDKGLSFDQVEGAIISSVVPPLISPLERMCEKYFNLKPMVIGPGLKTGLKIKADNPREIGADRIVNAVAGIHEYGTPLIIVDFGTATTFCFIDEEGGYHGGAIAPGISISTEALYSRAAKLPRIELMKPPSVIGRNTIHAMQSGIVFGLIGQVDGIVRMMKKETKSNPRVIATGGLASLVETDSAEVDTVDSWLTLKGLRLIYERNKK